MLCCGKIIKFDFYFFGSLEVYILMLRLPRSANLGNKFTRCINYELNASWIMEFFLEGTYWFNNKNRL